MVRILWQVCERLAGSNAEVEMVQAEPYEDHDIRNVAHIVAGLGGAPTFY